MFEHFIFFVNAQGTYERNYRKAAQLVEITSSFQSVTRQLALLRDLTGRMFSREDVTWNWYYYHQLIVIVLRTVKGTLRGSVKVPGGKVNLYRQHLPIREAILPREK